MNQVYSPTDPPRPRRRPPSPTRLPLTRAEIERNHVAKLRRALTALLDEYEWTHAMAYGQASSSGVGGGDIAYSDPTTAIALRGTNSTVRDHGGAPVDGETDLPSLSALRRSLLDTERRIDQATSALMGGVTALRRSNRTGKNPPSQKIDVGKGIGASAIKESLEAQRRRAERGEGRGEG